MSIVAEKIKKMSNSDIKDRLWHLGYRGVDELSIDEAYDKLVEYYEQNEKEQEDLN